MPRQVPAIDRFLLEPLLLVAFLLWLAGVALPVMTVIKLSVLYEPVVIWEQVVKLLDEGSIGLAAIVILFTLLIPLAKLSATWFGFRQVKRNLGDKAQRSVGWIERFGKWSMLDVFVIAVAIFAAKSGWPSEGRIETGLYCFAGFALLSSALALRVKHLAHRSPGLPSANQPAEHSRPPAKSTPSDGN